LGHGSGGVVFLARDRLLDRSVAIKILKQAGDAQALARFEQEARAAGALEHPNVLVVHDVGVDRGSPFIVSELLSGRTLRARLQEGPLSADEALTLALQLARGHVETDRITEYVIVGFVFRYIAASSAYHDGQLDLPVEFGRAFMIDHFALLADYGGRRLGEKNRPLGIFDFQ